jgi:hypothetical protein
MRVLGLRYESVKRAIEIRKAVVDSAAGWKLIKTAPHRDRIDWSPLKKWLHSDEASTPDNDHKTEVKVDVADDGCVVSYELHDRRYWNDKLAVLRERFRTTPAYASMN